MSTIVERHISCPNCQSSDAYCLYDDGHGYCFSCQHYKKGKEDEESSYTYEYLPRRGLVEKTLRKYNIKTKINSEGKPVSVGYPYVNDSCKVRMLDEKAFYSVGDISKAGLFGKDKFEAGSHKYLTITEGEDDAASLYQVLHSPVCSVQSASTAVRDCVVDRSFINSFERVYLAFDNDAAGRRATAEVARLFDYNKVFQVKFNKYKDANAYVDNGEGDTLVNLWWNSRAYLPDNIISSFSDFADILKQKPKYGIRYPFKQLTEMTYGIRKGESILITAQEGIGKTELMHFIEHTLLKETDDVDNIGAIFLEEKKQRHLQALSGIELSRAVHLPDVDVPEDQVIAALERAVRKDGRLHVYSHFGSDDPEHILDTIRFLVTACSCQYIMFDHITMAVTGLEGEDERIALDHLSTRLEMMVKELNFALIFVSHVNDEGKTRGSRFISKIADIRIDLFRDLLAADPVRRRTTELRVSKNRYASETGPAGSIIFDPDTYSYHEITEAEKEASAAVEAAKLLKHIVETQKEWEDGNKVS